MPGIYIGVGSNIDPDRNVRQALLRLAEETTVKAISTFYRTRPVGSRGQPFFYNGVVEVATDLPPRELKQSVLLEIEAAMGRRRSADRYASRPIDLDIVLYGDLVISGEGLTIPDPEIAERPFLAFPLHELEPGLVIPGSIQTIAEIVSRLDPSGMEPLLDYTERLRRNC